MTPSKVSRNAVTFQRFWTAQFGAPDEHTKIRPVRLVQGFDSRKDADAARQDLLRWHPTMCVVDLAEVIMEARCLRADSAAYMAELDARYEASRAALIATEGSAS